jgi:4,5-DOPA dioxygenase extradiol
VSAHYESDCFAITCQEKLKTIHDHGFGEVFYYEYKNARGDPELGKRIYDELKKANLPTKIDKNWGLDHGVWTVLKFLYPTAVLPIVSISLKTDYDVADHIKLGEVLSKFQNENYLVIGTGSLTHNLRFFFEQMQNPK